MAKKKLKTADEIPTPMFDPEHSELSNTEVCSTPSSDSVLSAPSSPNDFQISLEDLDDFKFGL
jgi:hypothetical protein